MANSKTDTGTTDDPRKFPFPPALPVLALLASWALGKLWPIEVNWPEWSRVLGWILVTMPFLLAVWSVATFRRHKTPVNPRGNVVEIVTNGPFRFTRNPMYLALMIVYIGGVLVFRLVWGALWLIPLFLSLQYGVIRPEERYMNAKFGDEYIRYTRRVRRWI